MNIGKKVKEERERLGIKQRELVRRIHMSGQMISKIERGISTSSIETLSKIADALGISIYELFKEAAPEVPEQEHPKVEVINGCTLDNEALEILRDITILVSEIEQRLEKLEKRIAAPEVPVQEQPKNGITANVIYSGVLNACSMIHNKE